MRRKSNRKLGAFTLVELLVVVSIIALLIAILLPSLKSARDQAKTVQCNANLRSMGMGVGLYSDDHNQVLPGPIHPPIYRLTMTDDDSYQDWSNPGNNNTRWFLLYRLAPYFSKADSKSKGFVEYADKVATCPSAASVRRDSDFKPGYHVPVNLEDDDADRAELYNPEHSRPFNYLPNVWSNTKPAMYFGWVDIGSTWFAFENGKFERTNAVKTVDGRTVADQHTPVAPISRDLIKRSSDEWMIGDAWRKRTEVPVVIDPMTIETAVTLIGTWQGTGGNSWYPLPRRPYHGSQKTGTNLVYFDGHAATYKGYKDWAVDFPANRWDPE